AYQGLAAQSRQQRELERRAIALELAASALEQSSQLPYAEISTDGAGQLGTIQQSLAALPQGKLDIDIEPVTDPVPGKRVGLSVSWNSNEGTKRVRLTTWVYAPAETQP